MKKLGLIIVVTAMIFAFCSCEKENLGAFNPKKKISKVYTENNGHYLREQWIWNENQLQQVEYYRKNGNVDYTCHYQYDNGLLSRIEMDDQHTDFIYEGKMLASIETYNGEQLVETYTLSFEKKKLSHISVRKFAKSVDETNLDFLHLLFPCCDNPLDSYVTSTGVKKENYDYGAAEIDFVWEDDNVKYMKMKLNRPDSVQNLTFTYVYDDNINPKKNYFSVFVNQMLLNDEPQTFFCSANNAIGVYVTDSYDIFSESVSFTYAYDYYKKYPTKVYSTWFDDESLTEKKELIYSYEYLN